jgi:glycosidase
LDGRTTIFDYWTVDTIRRWRNKGKFDGSLLTSEEQSLQRFYANVMHIKEQEVAFAEGDFFDLMYQNPSLHQQYVFARKGKRNVMLIVANFSETEQQMQINIPLHMFELWNIKERLGCSCVDLLTGYRSKVDFCSERAFNVTVPATGGCVFKIIA